MKNSTHRKKLIFSIGVFLLLFLTTALSAAALSGRMELFDQFMADSLRDLESVFLTAFFRVITFTGSSIFSAIIITGLMVYGFARLKSRRFALTAAITAASSAGVNIMLKEITARARPSLYPWLTHAAGFSFPSGHTQSAVIIAGLVILFARGISPNRKSFLLIPAIRLWVFAIALSRVYLGVHYASDVIGGFLFGLVFIILARKCAIR
ncbi:MAG: phosphatase PAP2 family protein [Spirochaetales bacterium]|jgi:membrane-associated phospholipid phosphatase|nr:phosphatase PAP2 family protein [Spirochaetales bacterium]